MDMDAINARLDAFAKLLPHLCDAETTADRDGWTSENPLWGHCAVASLVAQDRFGGTLLRASLEKVPKFAHMRSHYWNRFPHGAQRDFTRPQFGADAPEGLEAEDRTRAYVLSHAATMERYKLLSWRLARVENCESALFDDDLYRQCYMAAMGSPCQKMRFGCVLTYAGEVVATACNGTIEPLKHLCEPKCIRLEIKSRTESTLGACEHAEEAAIWKVVRQGIMPLECDLYIAGVHMNGAPWLKEEAVHTCLRCATMMYQADIQRIFVPVGSKWESITAEQAVTQAAAYATGQKTV